MADKTAQQFLERMTEIEDRIAMLEAGLNEETEVVQHAAEAHLKKVAALTIRLSDWVLRRE